MGDNDAATTTTTMPAVLMHGHGGPEVLRPATVPRPGEPGQGELLVRVDAASVNPLDYKVRRGDLWFLTRWRLPFVPGSDLAGEVVATGPGVSALREGDRVYAVLNGVRGGAYAAYATVPERQAARAPANVGVEEAASLPMAALTALQALRDRAGVREPGRRVLVNGASGGVGTAAVQIGKALGAEVTAVCGAAARGLVEELGADRVIDYRERDFTQGPERYDVVFDVVGNRDFTACRGVLTGRGVYVTTQPSPRHVAANLLTAVGGRRARTMIVVPRRADLDEVRRMVEQGQLRPVVDRVFPLAEAAAAHAYAEREHPRGKVVLRVEETA